MSLYLFINATVKIEREREGQRRGGREPGLISSQEKEEGGEGFLYSALRDRGKQGMSEYLFIAMVSNAGVKKGKRGAGSIPS